MYTLSSTFIKKISTFVTLWYYAKVAVGLKKTQTRNSYEVLIMRPSSTLKFHFDFCFDESLRNISLIKF